MLDTLAGCSARVSFSVCCQHCHGARCRGCAAPHARRADPIAHGNGSCAWRLHRAGCAGEVDNVTRGRNGNAGFIVRHWRSRYRHRHVVRHGRALLGESSASPTGRYGGFAHHAHAPGVPIRRGAYRERGIRLPCIASGAAHGLALRNGLKTLRRVLGEEEMQARDVQADLEFEAGATSM